jgi:hypothetical protein
VRFFDKVEVRTISGVSRDVQRRIYDARKREAARRAGYLVVKIPWERRPLPPKRDPAADLDRLRDVLLGAGVDI